MSGDIEGSWEAESIRIVEDRAIDKVITLRARSASDAALIERLKKALGSVCPGDLPAEVLDTHRFPLVWSNDGGQVSFTGAQYREARAALAEAEGRKGKP